MEAPTGGDKLKPETILRAYARIELHLQNSPDDPDAIRKRMVFAKRLTGRGDPKPFQSENAASWCAAEYRVWNRLIDGPSYIFEGGHMFYDFEALQDWRGDFRSEVLALRDKAGIVEINLRGDTPKVRAWKGWPKKPRDWMVVVFGGNWWEHIGRTR